MVEADTLCDRIGIMNRGKLAVIGTPSELKSTVGGDVITVTAKNTPLSAVVEELGYETIGEPLNGTADLLVKNGETAIPRIVQAFKGKGVELDSVYLKNPTLDDFEWAWEAAKGERPDEYQRQRMIQIHANHPDQKPDPDHGYSSWIMLEDGRIFLVDYTNYGDEPGKSHLVGVYLDPEDIA